MYEYKLPVELEIFPEMNEQILDRLRQLERKYDIISPTSIKQSLSFIASLYSEQNRALTEPELDLVFDTIDIVFYRPLSEKGLKFRSTLVNIIDAHSDNMSMLTLQAKGYIKLSSMINSYNASEASNLLQKDLVGLDKLIFHYESMLSLVSLTLASYPCLEELCSWATDTLKQGLDMLRSNLSQVRGLYKGLIDKKLIEVN
jgi:hypothetical protein